MPSAKPTLELLRSLTEEHILRALMKHGRLTRAEISSRTGISKPTISVGVRRLEEAGIVIDTQEFSTGRGRAGNYYTFAPDCGLGLVVVIGPHGVTAETLDPFGAQVSSSAVPLDHSPGPKRAAKALTTAVQAATAAAGLPIRTTMVSAADPVDRSSGKLVHLPDAPFLVGALDPTEAILPFVQGPILVDNDVNWAARAEHASTNLAHPDNFVYLHLGIGLGFAVVSDGVVWRGHSGLAGEIAHILTYGVDGQAARLIDIFGELGLRHETSTAIDQDKLHQAFTDSSTRTIVARAVAGVLASAIGFADPSAAVVAGWGRDPQFLNEVQQHLDQAPRKISVHPAALDDRPEHIGARTACLDSLCDVILARIPSVQ